MIRANAAFVQISSSDILSIESGNFQTTIFGEIVIFISPDLSRDSASFGRSPVKWKFRKLGGSRMFHPLSRRYHVTILIAN